MQYLHLSALENDILQILTAYGNTYGLKILDRMNEERKAYDLPEVGYGAFYGALKKLEREKLLKASSPEADKRRKYYNISALGEKTLSANNSYRIALHPKFREQKERKNEK